MIALAFILGTTLAASLALVAWLTYQLVSSVHSAADTLVLKAEAEAEFERTLFELDTERDVRKEAERLADALQEELHHALSQVVVGAGLADDDVDNRVSRLWDKYKAARSARDPVPAGEGPAVPVADGPVADGRPAPGDAAPHR